MALKRYAQKCNYYQDKVFSNKYFLGKDKKRLSSDTFNLTCPHTSKTWVVLFSWDCLYF